MCELMDKYTCFVIQTSWITTSHHCEFENNGGRVLDYPYESKNNSHQSQQLSQHLVSDTQVSDVQHVFHPRPPPKFDNYVDSFASTETQDPSAQVGAKHASK